MGKVVSGSFQSRNMISSLQTCLSEACKGRFACSLGFKWAKEPQCWGRGSPGDLGERGFWEDSGSPAFDSA